MTKDEAYYQQLNDAEFAAKLNTSEQLTAQTIQSIVAQLRAMQVDGKFVFDTVYLERAGDERIHICTETWGDVGRNLFYVSEEEISKLELED